MIWLAALLLTAPQDGGPFDPDPRFPANRLHRAMYTWTPGGPRMPAGYEPDPLFWPLSLEPWKFTDDLLPAIDAVAASLPSDPLRRALLQHDVWMFFDSLDGLPFAGNRTWPPETAELRADVRRRLAPLLRRLALAPEELRALPDPYARAVASKTWPAAFDPSRPTAPFLPSDIDAADGPWVLVGAQEPHLTARLHATHFSGHAVFLIHLALPAGRAATLDYLKRLEAEDVLDQAPRPPEGTKLLLRRRAFLLDVRGEPVLSPVTQEIQLRVARPKGALADGDGLFDFRLRRGDLVAGKPGLHAAAVEDQGAVFLFHRGPARLQVRKSCLECHGSLATPLSAFRMEPREGQRGSEPRSKPLSPSTPEREAEATLASKRADRTWKALREAWPKD